MGEVRRRGAMVWIQDGDTLFSATRVFILPQKPSGMRY